MEILEGIHSKEIDYGIVDLLTLAAYKSELDEKQVKVRAIIKTDSGFGWILSGLTRSLQYDVEEAISARSQTISEFMEGISDQIPVSNI